MEKRESELVQKIKVACQRVTIAERIVADVNEIYALEDVNGDGKLITHAQADMYEQVVVFKAVCCERLLAAISELVKAKGLDEAARIIKDTELVTADYYRYIVDFLLKYDYATFPECFLLLSALKIARLS